MSTVKRTIKLTKAQLKAIGVTLTHKPYTDEYRVNLKGGTEATAYYTNDLEDAFRTGVTMAGHKAMLELWPGSTL